MTEVRLCVKIYNDENCLKNINQPLVLNSKEWKTHLKTLRTVQKDVNVFLTQLVDEEHANDDLISDENDEAEESESDYDDVKRKPEVTTGHKAKRQKNC